MGFSDLDSADGVQNVGGDVASGYSPDTSSTVAGSGTALFDGSNRLETHSTVLSDEGSVRDDFTGAAFAAEWTATTATSGTATVANSLATFTLTAANGSTAYISRPGDYLPYTFSCLAALTSRNANQQFVIGFESTPFANGINAYVSFTGTTNTQVIFTTGSSSAAADTQSTTVTLPLAAVTSSYNLYKIDVSGNSCSLIINGTTVATHTTHIPGPYDNLNIVVGGKNTGASSAATFNVDFVYFANWDRLQIDNDFQGEPISVNVANSPIVIPTPSASLTDAFGRQRVSSPALLTTLYFANTSHDLLTNTSNSGTGSSAYNSATSSVRLTTGGTASGATAIRQTKRYLKYNSGIGYIITVAANVGAKKTNVRKRWGIFDDLNGSFFQDDGTNLSVVTRTNASGSAVDKVVNQSAWNIDKMDGTGPSGLTLDQSKHQLWVIDYIWHGAGPVRFGIHIGGKLNYVHQVLSGNTLTSPFTRTPLAPIRAEIANTGTAASATTMDVVCITAAAEDGSSQLLPSYNFSGSNGQTPKTVSTTLIPILSIRPKTTFNGIVNRAPVSPIDFDVVTAAVYLEYQFIFNPTLTGAAFASAGTFSSVEIDTTATAVTGGTVIYSGYSTNASKGGSSNLDNLTDEIILGLDVAGTTADILTVAARANANNNATYAAVRWQEFQ